MSRVAGRSSSEVILPNWPIARDSSPPSPPVTSEPFQNPKAQCALKADIPASMPRYMK